jgi:23S rRNA (adenine2030-N6)-methyltransferase
VLRYLAQKEKPFWCIDTHAGAAIHDLEARHARTNAEFESGIARLWARKDLPAAAAEYVAEVRALNPEASPGEPLRFYPGSPQLATQLLRKQDRLRMFELHSTESRLLQDYFAKAAPRVIAQPGDGFTGLLALLPPPSRRGLVLMDPSYEDKADYRHVLTTLSEGLRRFATGVYMVWYPHVQRREAFEFADKLKRAAPGEWLHAALDVKAPAENGLGLHGSGIFVLNPPWTLAAALREVLPYLVKVLGQDSKASYILEHLPA